jgi:hypothetical protein
MSVMVATILAPAVAFAGNGAPNGKHYNLNIIGLQKSKKAPMEGSNRHTIFVSLVGKCDIGLSMGDFRVADGSCTDGDRAEFLLPDPRDGDNTESVYSVYVRVVAGKGSFDMTTCYTDSSGSWCNAGDLELKDVGKGKKFQNVSKELLTICYYDEDTKSYTKEALFDRDLEDYFWHYDNIGPGVRLAQFRFYPVSSPMDWDDPCENGRKEHPNH